MGLINKVKNTIEGVKQIKADQEQWTKDIRNATDIYKMESEAYRHNIRVKTDYEVNEMKKKNSRDIAELENLRNKLKEMYS